VTSKILSRQDLDFMLFDWLGAEDLTTRPRFADHSRETFSAALDLSQRIATDFWAPANRPADLQEAHLENRRVTIAPEAVRAVHALVDSGLMAGAQDYELGGMQLPFLLNVASMAWLHAANTAICAFPLLTVGAANLLRAHGTPEMVERYVKPMLAGRFFGTMCLSEPDAGSSLANIRTRAVPQPDGAYRLSGAKMWISGGEHEVGENIIHMVLAKLPDAPPGVKGISLFLTPRRLLDGDGDPGEHNDVALVGLNHKMGTRGFPNALLNFGEGAHKPGGKSGAVGYLVGKPHQGLQAMFVMMNEARIMVGLSAAGLAYTSYLHAVDYARSRPQGYRPGPRRENDKQVMIIEHADVRRMLLAQKSYAEGALALCLYSAKLVDDHHTAPDESARNEALLLLELLTPITKNWSSQWAQEAASLAIQVHGGAGYTRDFPVEQFYRDNRLNAIHEGTQGIQGIDLLGRKVSLEGGRAFEVLRGRMRRTLRRATEDTELAPLGQDLSVRVDRLQTITSKLVALPDAETRLNNSNAYIEAFGHIVVAWLWLEQMLAATSSSDFHRGKRHAGKYFYRWELPKTDFQLDAIEALDDTCAAMNAAWY
jgi:alkylation response protein AidB-like acyl-CoA dehydrogenase